MDIQAEKIELVKLLLDTDSPEIINRVRSVFDRVADDFYDELPEHIKANIDKATTDIEKGDIYDHDDVMREFKTQYGIKSKVV
jgi:hypothetical protein